MDAVELIGPYDDEKLGFHRVAKYYYYPGWAEGTAMTHLVVNKPLYDELPKSYKVALDVAAAAVTSFQLAKYDASNGLALRRLVAQGAVLTLPSGYHRSGLRGLERSGRGTLRQKSIVKIDPRKSASVSCQQLDLCTDRRLFLRRHDVSTDALIALNVRGGHRT